MNRVTLTERTKQGQFRDLSRSGLSATQVIETNAIIDLTVANSGNQDVEIHLVDGCKSALEKEGIKLEYSTLASLLQERKYSTLIDLGEL